jgi:Lrp/AsnC family transcriptional regulator, leucine-responsive regulatory protein
MAGNRKQNGVTAEGALLDGINRRLLAELQADARLSLAELGRRVGLSSPAVAERLQRLERDEVILGYHARLNPRALGFALSAVIRVRPSPRQLQQIAEIARATPEVVDCRRITGEDCYVMTAHVRSVEHLELVIDRFSAYGQTTTSIVQSSPVPPRGLPSDEEIVYRRAAIGGNPRQRRGGRTPLT